MPFLHKTRRRRRKKKLFTRKYTNLAYSLGRNTKKKLYKLKKKAGMLGDMLDDTTDAVMFLNGEKPPVASMREMIEGRAFEERLKLTLSEMEQALIRQDNEGGSRTTWELESTRMGRLAIYKKLLLGRERKMLDNAAEARAAAYREAKRFYEGQEIPEQIKRTLITNYANMAAARSRRETFNNIHIRFPGSNQVTVDSEKMEAYRLYMADKGIVVNPMAAINEADMSFWLIE